MNKHFIEFFFEFVPQVVFFCGLFGYMCFLIMYKWVHLWEGLPPSILSVMINIYKEPGPENTFFEKSRQHTLQLRLLCKSKLTPDADLISVPLMLIVKPVLTHFTSKSHSHAPPDEAEPLMSFDSGKSEPLYFSP